MKMVMMMEKSYFFAECWNTSTQALCKLPANEGKCWQAGTNNPSGSVDEGPYLLLTLSEAASYDTGRLIRALLYRMENLSGYGYSPNRRWYFSSYNMRSCVGE